MLCDVDSVDRRDQLSPAFRFARQIGPIDLDRRIPGEVLAEQFSNRGLWKFQGVSALHVSVPGGNRILRQRHRHENVAAESGPFSGLVGRPEEARSRRRRLCHRRRLPERRKNGDTTAMNAISDDFDYPVQRLTLDGISLAYRDTRPESGDDVAASDLTVLCVHGNPTWSYYYRSVLQTFGSRYRVIAIDHIGCGMSDKPSRSEFDYTLANHQANLVSLIEHLGLGRVVLLAHDWGGAIGLGAVLACRDRFAGIMLLNTGAFPPPYVPWRIAACRIPLLGTLGVRGLNLFARCAVTMAMNRNRMRPAVAKKLLEPYDNWANRVAIDAFVRDIPMSDRHVTAKTLRDLEQALPTLAELPSLLVWGMKDWCFRPECLRRFQQAWPDATSVEIDDAGHYVIEDATDETLSAIDEFLTTRFS